MKVVALISGGKDSCFNMMHCVANGHDIIALANLYPPRSSGKDELDSFVYQTVGHDAIHYYAECMGLPLLRREIIGTPRRQEMDYEETIDDETEDLYALLSQVKTLYPEIEAVSVGAILSNYQRIRVEHVCNRLGLVSLAYLWRQDQKELLRSMVQSSLHAILIKIAAIGLKPAHLGKSLAQMEPIFLRLHNEFGLHVCGEGGEYETFTLDCPLFKKRIVVDEYDIVTHSDDAFAPVAYLRFKRVHLEEKENTVHCPVRRPDLDLNELVASYPYTTEVPLDAFSLPTSLPSKDVVDIVAPSVAVHPKGLATITNVMAIGANTIQEETHACMLKLQAVLEKHQWTWRNILSMHVFVQDMSHFACVNAVYKQFFGICPPARVCVQVALDHRIQIDCIISTDAAEQECRETMHVQGLSYWAPANIGPYSQCVKSNRHLFIAGQIGMIPASLQLPQCSSPSEQFRTEAALSLRHLERIGAAMEHPFTSHVVLCICYVTGPQWISAAQSTWQTLIQDRASTMPATLYVSVPALPRGALVEWQTILTDRTITSGARTLKVDKQQGILSGEAHLFSYNDLCMIAASLSKQHHATRPYSLEEASDLLIQVVNTALIRDNQHWSDTLLLRIFYDQRLPCSSVAHACQTSLKKYCNSSIPTAFVPVSVAAVSACNTSHQPIAFGATLHVYAQTCTD